jgi:tetratricopeptide (TPR) repeat protein
MTSFTGVLPLTRIAMQRAKIIPLFILTLFGTLLWLPAPGLAVQENPVVNENIPEVTELKQKAQDAYIHGRYAEAAAGNLKIAQKFPASKERHYAVQMLGTLYEDNLVDIKKAIKWDREFLKKYADPRQVSFYQEKVASLEKLINQEQAFKTYQAIRFANAGDEIMVKKFEALLKDHPDFLMKVEVERELGYAYKRLDKRKESYQAFQAVSRDAGKNVASTDRIETNDTGRYWEMTSTWGTVAWEVVVMLWVAVLLMKPWERVTRSTIRTFLIWATIWVVLTALRMPTFYAISTDADMIILHDSAVYLAAGLNLAVLLWILLLTKGNIWQTRPRVLLWLSPVLSLVMTAAVFFLFIIYQPNGPETTDVFAVKYEYLRGEIKERLHL